MNKRIFLLTIIVIALLSSIVFVASQTNFRTAAENSADKTSNAPATRAGTCGERLKDLTDGCDTKGCYNNLKTTRDEIAGKIYNVGGAGALAQKDCPQTGSSTVSIANVDLITSGASEQMEISVVGAIDALQGNFDNAVKTQYPAKNGDITLTGVEKGGFISVLPFFEQPE